MTEMATSAGPVKSAVVLNASDSLFGFLAGSMTEGDLSADSAGESDPTACRAGARCVVVARASDRRVNILGSAAAIPPFWLGGDSRDVYADRAAQGVLSFDEPARIVVHLARRRLKTGTLGFDSQSDDGSAQTGTQEPSGPGPANLSSAFNSGVRRRRLRALRRRRLRALASGIRSRSKFKRLRWRPRSRPCRQRFVTGQSSDGLFSNRHGAEFAANVRSFFQSAAVASAHPRQSTDDSADGDDP